MPLPVQNADSKIAFVVRKHLFLLLRNNRKMAGAQSNAETKKATIRMLRTIVVLTQSLHSLPDEVMMTMKLLYYDDGESCVC